METRQVVLSVTGGSCLTTVSELGVSKHDGRETGKMEFQCRMCRIEENLGAAVEKVEKALGGIVERPVKLEEKETEQEKSGRKYGAKHRKCNIRKLERIQQRNELKTRRTI